MSCLNSKHNATSINLLRFSFFKFACNITEFLVSICIEPFMQRNLFQPSPVDQIEFWSPLIMLFSAVFEHE